MGVSLAWILGWGLGWGGFFATHKYHERAVNAVAAAFAPCKTDCANKPYAVPEVRIGRTDK